MSGLTIHWPDADLEKLEAAIGRLEVARETLLGLGEDALLGQLGEVLELWRDPRSGVREELQAQGLPDAQQLRQLAHGSEAHYAGMVICRQRPGTAGGVVFMTLEDETGLVNVVLWDRVYQQFKVIAKTVSFLGISGSIQSDSGVVHLIAKKLWVLQLSQRPHRARSRDFH